MRWKLFADLAELAGPREVEVGAGHETVGEALEALFGEYPELRDRVMADGQVREDVNVLVNGEGVRAGEGLAAPVGDDDELALFPPVSGG